LEKSHKTNVFWDSIVQKNGKLSSSSTKVLDCT
jgi:hypothetical protein